MLLAILPDRLQFYASGGIVHLPVHTIEQEGNDMLYPRLNVISTVTSQSLQVIIHCNNSGRQEEIVTIFHICSDSELVTLILGSHLEAVPIFCAAKLTICEKHLHFIYV